jgi:outer membrane protein OmpA-like peptidoglycan-associated protein
MHPALKGSEVSGKGSPGEVALSARGRLIDALTGTLSLQTAVTPGAGASQFRLLAGVVLNNKGKPKDTDGDGLTDDIDACPTEPETVNNYMDGDGCPDELSSLAVTVVDPNNDPLAGIEVRVNGDLIGVTDDSGQLMVTDRIPGSAEITVTDPTGKTESDPQTMDLPEGSSNAEFGQVWRPGTIMVMARDGSGDPVDAAISWTGDVGTGDGMLGADGNEILVLGPGTWDLFARADGFKPERRAVELAPNEHSLQVIELSLLPATTIVTETSIVILEAINFEVNSAEIAAASQPIVDEVSTNLLLTPEIIQLEVQGHTDSQGSSSYNRDLSQRRVDSVVAAMVSRGVAASRLSAVGFGEDCSIANNGTVDGRAKNRRVQFFITDPAPADGVPCHDGRPGQDSADSIQLDRQVEVEQ